MKIKQKICQKLSDLYEKNKENLFQKTASDKEWIYIKAILFSLSILNCKRKHNKTWEEERRKINILYLKRAKGIKIK